MTKAAVKQYPDWVCQDCGLAASGGRQFKYSTYHFGHCNVCDGDKIPVTEPRDFFYPEFKGHEKLIFSENETIQNIFNNGRKES